MNLHQLSLVQIGIGAAVIIILLAMIQKWALSQLNGDPADDMDRNVGDKDAEILGDVPVRSKVGTPRPRRLQPLRSGEEMALSGSETLVPADSLAMAGASAFAKSKESSRADQPTTPAPAAKGPSSTEMKGTDGKAADIPKKTLILPPLSAAELAGTTPKTPAAPTTTPPADKGREPGVLPPLSTAATPPPAGGPTAKPADVKTEPVPPAPLTAPAVEKVADGVVAVGQPVSIAPAGSPAETDDDVKKRKNPPTAPAAETPRPGLTIIPKDASAKTEAKPAAGPVVPAEPIKPIEPPAAKITTSVPPDSKGDAGKSGGRPRIFLPANLPVTTDKPAEEPAPAAAIKPAVGSTAPRAGDPG